MGRLPALFAAALFFAGTNFCLVGALAAGGTPKSCCDMASSGAAHSGCPHHAAPAGSKPAPRTTAPCCIALTPAKDSPAPKLAHSAPALAVTPAAPAVPAPASRVAPKLARDTGPPVRPASSPLLGRAPPLL